MPKNLVIVESPAKAKTIEGYLGKDFLVKSSFGHVRDLPKGNNAIDIEHGFKPKYEISKDKVDIVRDLKKLSKDADIVWLATDDDREGEAISWHLKEALDLSAEKTKRIVFREITKPAILKAIENPRTIDMQLVNAQQARRVLDRLVGFEISPVLWKKIRTGLSAGRVQSVAVRLIVEREREIEHHTSTSDFKVDAVFSAKGFKFKATLNHRFKNITEAQAFLQACIGSSYQVDNIEVKPVKRSPAAPFTTSTLQQEASRKLGYSVAGTMQVAQRLYEAGHITYMRTDSVNLSETAMNAAKAEINNAYGKEYLQPRNYKTKSSTAQEAHEAIRPTDFSKHSLPNAENQERRLYELIWRRAIASQMSDAILEKTVVDTIIKPNKLEYQNYKYKSEGEVQKFDGFLKVYEEGSDHSDLEDSESAQLPTLSLGQEPDFVETAAVQRFSRPNPRYTEAALVKKLEEMGIGRPSTYAPTISTIIKREYVVKEAREGVERKYEKLLLKGNTITAQTLSEITGAEKNKLFPTDIGRIVTDFLVLSFPDIVDYAFTADVEKDFDVISNGGLEWNEMIDRFYTKFKKKVEDSALVDVTEARQVRELGVHPVTGKKIIARLSRYGAVVQMGDAEGDIKPQYANLKKTQNLENISLEQALELFNLPRTVGTYLGKDMVVADGRFGPYVRHDSKFYSLPKTEDPLTITEEECINIIEAKIKADSEKLIKSFSENDEVKILNGRWGPYIAFGKQNVKIPKGKTPEDLTYADCVELAEASPVKKSRGGARATSSAKTNAAPKTAKTTKSASKAKKAPTGKKSK